MYKYLNKNQFYSYKFGSSLVRELPTYCYDIYTEQKIKRKDLNIKTLTNPYWLLCMEILNNNGIEYIVKCFNNENIIIKTFSKMRTLHWVRVNASHFWYVNISNACLQTVYHLWSNIWKQYMYTWWEFYQVLSSLTDYWCKFLKEDEIVKRKNYWSKTIYNKEFVSKYKTLYNYLRAIKIIESKTNPDEDDLEKLERFQSMFDINGYINITLDFVDNELKVKEKCYKIFKEYNIKDFKEFVLYYK